MTTDAGTNWSLLEDVALCTSWVEVTHNSLTGNEMQLREMWSLIHTSFLEKIGGKRTEQSLSSRWRILSQSFSLWRDALAQASGNLRSGENLTDQVTIYYLFVCTIPKFTLPTLIIIISSPALCRHFKHKLGIMPKPQVKTNRSTGGSVGILSKIVLNLELCMSVQKFS